jgi:multimeric flavodoxin WrbA
MKVTVFVGSARKKHTYNAAKRFLHNLQSMGNVEGEIVVLSDFHLEICKGCKLCTDKGEELCPLKDDRDLLLEKLFASDGVVFATPNYSFNVSGQMKVFLDRLAFALHRPRSFGKAFSSITVEAIYRGRDIAKYLDFIGMGLRFNVVKGCVVKSLEPMTGKVRKRNEETIDRLSRKFYTTLVKQELPVPSLFELFMFHWGRTSLRLMLDRSWRDYRHYEEKGWFASDYFYPTRLNPLKKLAGNLVDTMTARKIRKGKPADDRAGSA